MNNTHPLGDPAELAALFAAGALTQDQLAAFEAHLAAGCDACQAELNEARWVTTKLWRAVGPVVPDPKIRHALLARIAAKPEAVPSPSPLRERVLDKMYSEVSSSSMLFNKASEASWERTAVEGVAIRTLFVDPENNQFTALVRMEPGASYPRHVHGGPEQCFVLEGDLRVGDEVLHAGDYQRAPTGSCHGVQSTEQGCLLLITSSLTDQFV
jgi:anti-sigma factor ChrR (cupin superfamily)